MSKIHTCDNVTKTNGEQCGEIEHYMLLDISGL